MRVYSLRCSRETAASTLPPGLYENCVRNKHIASCRKGRGFHTNRNLVNILRLDIRGAWSGRADRARGPARRTDAAGGRMARRMRGRGGARRQHRAASAPQTQARRRRRIAAVRRRPGRARGKRDRDESSGSAAGFRKKRERPTRGRADAAATGGEGNLAIAEPPRRKAQRAPAQEPRPPETGRVYPRHTSSAHTACAPSTADQLPSTSAFVWHRRRNMV